MEIEIIYVWNLESYNSHGIDEFVTKGFLVPRAEEMVTIEIADGINRIGHVVSIVWNVTANKTSVRVYLKEFTVVQNTMKDTFFWGNFRETITTLNRQYRKHWGNKH